MRIQLKSLRAALLAAAGGVLMACSQATEADNVQMVEAAAKQDMATVRVLLRKGADATTAQADGATALHWAVHWDDLEAADLLIDEGANLDAANEYGATALSLACTNGNAAMVEKLLDEGADANIATSSGETPLMRCARTGAADAVKALLAEGADAKAKDNESEQTALMWAVAQKHAGAAQALIAGGADVNARSKGGFTPLMFAARVGDLDSAGILIDAGAKVDEVGPAGMTPLVLAAASGQQAVATFLLDKGANPNAADEYGATAMHYATIMGITAINAVRYANYVAHIFRPSQQDLVKALIAHKANVNAQIAKPIRLGGGDSDALIGATPFVLAAATPDVTVMHMLADAGADTKMATSTKLTPLMAAAGVGRGQDFTEEEKKTALAAVQFAFELGGDVNATPVDGLTAMHGAATNGADAVVTFLAQKGAKLDVRDKYQQTPLSIATGERLPWIPYGEELGEIIQPSTRDLLLKLGATPLNTPGYFKPPAEGSDAYRINAGHRGLNAPPPVVLQVGPGDARGGGP